MVLKLFKLIPPCATTCAQFTAAIEALYFKLENSETNLSYIPSFLYSVNPNDPSQKRARKTNSV